MGYVWYWSVGDLFVGGWGLGLFSILLILWDDVGFVMGIWGVEDFGFFILGEVGGGYRGIFCGLIFMNGLKKYDGCFMMYE